MEIKNKFFPSKFKSNIGDWGLGIGDWGLGDRKSVV